MATPSRRDFLTQVALAGAAALGQRAFAQAGSERRPNIVLLYSDDQAWEDLGCFGDPRVKTPHLDRLAAEGIRLTNFYAASSICTPARSGLLTGRYPQRNGLYEIIRSNETNYKHQYAELEYCFTPEMTQGLDVREITIGDALQGAGYKTGVFGKWDSGRAPRFMPLQRGFDDFYGFSNTGIDYYTHERYGMPSLFRGNTRITGDGYATELFKGEALRFLDAHQDEPFFLYVPFNAPHGASNLEMRMAQAPQKYLDMYSGVENERQRRYYAAITCMDAAIGAILGRLEKLGLAEDTVVLFTSDQGAGKSPPLRGGKGKLSEGGIRTPFVARWPGHIPAGAVSDAFCSTLDLLPTFVRLAGGTLPDVKLDGYDMLPVLTGGAESKRTEQFWELRGHRAARVGTWKWLVETRRRWELPEDATGELYDLSVDPEEKHNLAGEKPEVLRMMQRKWDTWMREMVASEFRGPFGKVYFDKLGYGNGNYRLEE